MIRLLRSGGMPVVLDHVRPLSADGARDDVELGHNEQLHHSGAKSCLHDLRGKAIRVPLWRLSTVPSSCRYKMVYLYKSVGNRLTFRNPRQVIEALATLKEWDTLFVDYNQLFCHPRAHCERINSFLGGGLDVERMTALLSS